MSIRESILVVFPGALGDLICLLPALAALRGRGGADVTLMSGHHLRELFDGSQYALEAIEGEGSAALFSATRSSAEGLFRRFDRVISFSGFGVPEVHANLERWNGSVYPFRPGRREHLATHFLRCVGGEVAALPTVHLPGIERFQAEGSSWRRNERLNNSPLLVVHPGSGGVAKCWSRSGFRDLAGRWQRRGGAVRILLGPAEVDDTETWRRSELPILQTSSLRLAASVLAASDAYVGNDSGISHLAAAAGAAGWVLFGPTDPECWRPLSPRIAVHQPTPWTSREEPTSLTEISFLDQQLMQVPGKTFP